MTQTFFVKCLKLLKEQERKLEQEYLRVFGVETPTDSGSNSRLESHSGGDDDEGDGESLLFDETMKKPPTTTSYRDGDGDVELGSAKTFIVNKKLKKIETDFKLVNSIYGEMSDLQMSQSEQIHKITSGLDSVVKKTALAREDLKITNEETNATASVGQAKKVGVILLTLLVTILIFRVFQQQ